MWSVHAPSWRLSVFGVQKGSTKNHTVNLAATSITHLKVDIIKALHEISHSHESNIRNRKFIIISFRKTSMSLLVLECMRKLDEVSEGIVLDEFVKMIDPDLVEVVNLQYSSHLIELLEDEERMENFMNIHLCGRGEVDDADDAYFFMPNGRIHPYDFPEDCFKDKVVTISASALGRTAFIHPFIEQTGAEIVIAPQRDLCPVDAAIWYVNYFYFLLHHERLASTAFERTEEHLDNYARGGFQCWYNDHSDE